MKQFVVEKLDLTWFIFSESTAIQSRCFQL